MIAHALFAAALALLPTPDWYRIAESDTSISYVDAASIERGGQWTRFTQWTENRLDNNGIKRVNAIEEIDCAARKIRILHFTGFKPDGSVSADVDLSGEGASYDIPAASSWGLVANFVCSGDLSLGTRVDSPEADAAERNG